MITLTPTADLPTETVRQAAPTWPNWLDTILTSRYLREVHGLIIEPKTLANWRRLGRGPPWKYQGGKPLAHRQTVDHWVERDALQDESPLSRLARERRRRASKGRRMLPRDGDIDAAPA